MGRIATSLVLYCETYRGLRRLSLLSNSLCALIYITAVLRSICFIIFYLPLWKFLF